MRAVANDRLMRRAVTCAIAIVIVLLAASALLGCQSRTIALRSGLKMTVPPGFDVARADPTTAMPEFVSVIPLPNQQWSTSFASLATTRALTVGTVIASSEDSRVVVRQKGDLVVVATRVPGAMYGEVWILPHDKRAGASGLALAREVWTELSVTGARLP